MAEFVAVTLLLFVFLLLFFTLTFIGIIGPNWPKGNFKGIFRMIWFGNMNQRGERGKEHARGYFPKRITKDEEEDVMKLWLNAEESMNYRTLILL